MLPSPGTGKQTMVCSQGVKGSIHQEVGRMREPRDSGDAQSRHGALTTPVPEGAKEGRPPQHPVLCCRDWTGTVGQETTRGRSALASPPALCPPAVGQVHLEAQGHGSGVRPSGDPT